MENRLLERLRIRLSEPLPGEEVQLSMAPAGRERLRDLRKKGLEPRHSAVLLLLFPEQESFRLILIRRPEYAGVHGGQISFPGGKKEEHDLDLRHTALRETCEEIGVPENEVRILGRLSDIYIPPSNFMVSPFLGVLPDKPVFRPDPREVAEIITVELLSLAQEDRRLVKSIRHSDGIHAETPYYDIEGFTVWGATAMMIAELNVILKEIISS